MNNKEIPKNNDGYLYPKWVILNYQEDSGYFAFIQWEEIINKLWFWKSKAIDDEILPLNAPIIRIPNKDGRMLQLEPDMSWDLLIRFVDEIESEEDIAELL